MRVAAPAWQITVPARPAALAGLVMAGFSDRANTFAEVALVPHPAVTLLLDLGEDPFVVEDARGVRQCDRIVAGLAPSGARGVGLARSSECLQLRLSPPLARAVLGECGQLGGTLAALDDLWGSRAVRLQERVRAARSWQERFAIAEAELTRVAAGNLDPEVGHAWRRMVASGGRVRVERLVGETGWSRKRLWSRFRAQVGLTPKRAAQLVRFDHAAHRLAAGQRAAVVAAESGYVDQSHLHRDVTSFAGMTPRELALTPFLAVDPVAWPA